MLLVICTVLFFRMQNSSFECLGHDKFEMARTIAINFSMSDTFSIVS